MGHGACPASGAESRPRRGLRDRDIHLRAARFFGLRGLSLPLLGG